MKRRLLFVITAILIGVTGAVNAQDQKKVTPVDPIGTWSFTAAEAPYGYEKGDLVISEGEKGLKVKIVFNEYSKTDAYKVKYDDNKLTCTVYVEDESVYMSVNFVKDTFKGKASTSQGDIGLVGAKKKAVKK